MESGWCVDSLGVIVPRQTRVLMRDGGGLEEAVDRREGGQGRYLPIFASTAVTQMYVLFLRAGLWLRTCFLAQLVRSFDSSTRAARKASDASWLKAFALDHTSAPGPGTPEFTGRAF